MPKTKKKEKFKKPIQETFNQTDLKQIDLIILRRFDLNHKFGPCYGVKRLERWHWADRNGLAPPRDIKSLVEAHSNDPDYTESIWYQYKSII